MAAAGRYLPWDLRGLSEYESGRRNNSPSPQEIIVAERIEALSARDAATLRHLHSISGDAASWYNTRRHKVLFWLEHGRLG